MSRRPGYRIAVFGSAMCTTTGIPIAMACSGAPRWLAVLALFFLTFGGMAIAGIAAVMPQESDDRLSWWRELLGHRERMARHRDAERPAQQVRSTRGACSICHPSSGRRDPKILRPGMTSTSRTHPPSIAPVTQRASSESEHAERGSTTSDLLAAGPVGA
jgi:hypothetical protein